MPVAIAVIAALQVLAVWLYLRVERGRHAQGDPPFAYERVGTAPALPDISLLHSDGSALRASSLRDRPLLLHFWATWCAPCREELPSLLQLARQERTLRVVAISLDDDWPLVRSFFPAGIPLEVTRDPTRAMIRTFEVSALPDTYLIARNGLPALRFGGARRWQSAAARTVLAPYLAR